MKLCRLSGYGVFDMGVTYPGVKRTKNRTVQEYEIEYFISKMGKAIVNGREYHDP